MKRKVVGSLADAGKLLAGMVALVALVLLSLRGWGRMDDGSAGRAMPTQEQEGQTEPASPDGNVTALAPDEVGRSGVGTLGKDGLPVPSAVSASDVAVRSEVGEVEQVATRLLASYRDGHDCVLADAEYLDLLGSVWGCVVQGDQWVDVCVVERVDDASCRVHVMRMNAPDVAEALGADAPVDMGSGEGDGG